MADKPFTSETVIDALASFEAGINSGNAPLLLPKNQLSFATNTTVRGAYATHRPPISLQTLNFGGDASMEAGFKGGLFQGAGYYKPDSTVERLLVSISGGIFLLTPTATDWTVTDISIPGDYNDPTVTQVWMWQAEKWMIITDGTTTLPIYWTLGTLARRSIGNIQALLTITSGPWNVPANGADTVVLTLAAAPNPPWPIGTPINGLFGEYVVKTLVGNQLVLTRISDVPAGITGTAIAAGALIYPEFPAGRMGAYGMGRVWMSLIDGKQFLAGDINGGPSGTLANNFRDAVLRTTENTYLNGGGYFSTPGAWGDIRAMIFASTLDVSMGQGPLQIITPTRCFSCMAPTDRLTWSGITNPILTESLISNGGEGQHSTVNANGDIIMRSVDGIRSLVMGKRDFETYGNTPISSEMDRVLSLDVEDLLPYGSAIVFDNRLLMTVNPSAVPEHGVFHPGLAVMNFDALSNMRGKAPSVYDGLWSGMNTLRLVVGRFSEIERGFAFTYNLGLQSIELYEILTTPKDVFATVNWPEDDEIYDNSNTSIVWTIESSCLFKSDDPRNQKFHRLFNGELLVDNLVGTVDFWTFWKPDQYPCWQPWFSWSECAKRGFVNSKPQFRPRMGLGEPPANLCDTSTNRPLREGFTFQWKLIVRGHCRVLGARFKAITLPIPEFAKQACNPPCTDIQV